MVRRIKYTFKASRLGLAISRHSEGLGPSLGSFTDSLRHLRQMAFPARAQFFICTMNKILLAKIKLIEQTE